MLLSIKSRVAAMVCQGRPLMHNIQSCYRDLDEIMKKLPAGKSINSGLSVMHTYLKAAVIIAERTNFATSKSDASIVEDQLAPAMNPLIATFMQKCKSTAKDVHIERNKKTVPLPQVDLSEHLEEMDQTAEKSKADTGLAAAAAAAAAATPISAPSVAPDEDKDIDVAPWRKRHNRPWSKPVCVWHRVCYMGTTVAASWTHTWKQQLHLLRGFTKMAMSWCHVARNLPLITQCGGTTKVFISGKFYYYCAVKGCTSGKNGGKYGANGAN